MPVIKRYANRKLYDTESKRYVTLEELAEFVRSGEEVQVVDHVTGEDLTSTTLLQVIFDEQKKIAGLFPQVALTRLIRAGGSTVSSLRSRLGWLDPFQLVDDEIARRIQSLVDKGTLPAEEGRRLTELLVHHPTRVEAIHIPVQGEEAEPPAPEEEPVDPAEVEALLRQVEALEQELALLNK